MEGNHRSLSVGGCNPTQVPVSSRLWPPLGKRSRWISSYVPTEWAKGRFWELLSPHSLGSIYGPCTQGPTASQIATAGCWRCSFLPVRAAATSRGKTLSHVFQLRSAKQQKKGCAPCSGPTPGRQTGPRNVCTPEAKRGYRRGSGVPAGAETFLLSASPPSSLSPSEHQFCQGCPGSKAGLGPGRDIQSLLGQDMTKMTTIPLGEKDIFHQGPQDCVSGSPSHFRRARILRCQFL